MEIKTLALSKPKAISLAKFAALLAVAIIAPLLHFQPITGPIVNATLFLAASLIGLRAGIAIGILPSLIALASGTLPSQLFFMVPFIITGNAILVSIFYFLKSKSSLFAILASSFLKFLFLFLTSQVLITFFLQGKIAKTVSLMMSWPQFTTALIGGLIALAIIKIIKK